MPKFKLTKPQQEKLLEMLKRISPSLSDAERRELRESVPTLLDELTFDEKRLIEKDPAKKELEDLRKAWAEAEESARKLITADENLKGINDALGVPADAAKGTPATNAYAALAESQEAVQQAAERVSEQEGRLQEMQPRVDDLRRQLPALEAEMRAALSGQAQALQHLEEAKRVTEGTLQAAKKASGAVDEAKAAVEAKKTVTTQILDGLQEPPSEAERGRSIALAIEEESTEAAAKEQEFVQATKLHGEANTAMGAANLEYEKATQAVRRVEGEFGRASVELGDMERGIREIRASIAEVRVKHTQLKGEAKEAFEQVQDLKGIATKAEQAQVAAKKEDDEKQAALKKVCEHLGADKPEKIDQGALQQNFVVRSIVSGASKAQLIGTITTAILSEKLLAAVGEAADLQAQADAQPTAADVQAKAKAAKEELTPAIQEAFAHPAREFCYGDFVGDDRGGAPALEKRQEYINKIIKDIPAKSDEDKLLSLLRFGMPLEQIGKCFAPQEKSEEDVLAMMKKLVESGRKMELISALKVSYGALKQARGKVGTFAVNLVNQAGLTATDLVRIGFARSEVLAPGGQQYTVQELKLPENGGLMAADLVDADKSWKIAEALRGAFGRQTFTLRELVSVGVEPKELTGVVTGVSVLAAGEKVDLSKLAQRLKEERVPASVLHAASKAYPNAGYDAPEFLGALVTAPPPPPSPPPSPSRTRSDEVSAFAAIGIENAGGYVPLTEEQLEQLRPVAAYTLLDLARGGFSKEQLESIPGYTEERVVAEIRGLLKNAKSADKQKIIEDLVAAGFGEEVLKKCGDAADQILPDGFIALSAGQNLAQAESFPSLRCFHDYYSVDKEGKRTYAYRSAGGIGKLLLNAGYSIEQLVDGGYTAAELLQARLEMAGMPGHEIKLEELKACFLPTELHVAGRELVAKAQTEKAQADLEVAAQQAQVQPGAPLAPPPPPPPPPTPAQAVAEGRLKAVKGQAEEVDKVCNIKLGYEFIPTVLTEPSPRTPADVAAKEADELAQKIYGKDLWEAAYTTGKYTPQAWKDRPRYVVDLPPTSAKACFAGLKIKEVPPAKEVEFDPQQPISAQLFVEDPTTHKLKIKDESVLVAEDKAAFNQWRDFLQSTYDAVKDDPDPKKLEWFNGLTLEQLEKLPRDRGFDIEIELNRRVVEGFLKLDQPTPEQAKKLLAAADIGWRLGWDRFDKVVCGCSESDGYEHEDALELFSGKVRQKLANASAEMGLAANEEDRELVEKRLQLDFDKIIDECGSESDREFLRKNRKQLLEAADGVFAAWIMSRKALAKLDITEAALDVRHPFLEKTETPAGGKVIQRYKRLEEQRGLIIQEGGLAVYKGVFSKFMEIPKIVYNEHTHALSVPAHWLLDPDNVAQSVAEEVKALGWAKVKYTGGEKNPKARYKVLEKLAELCKPDPSDPLQRIYLQELDFTPINDKEKKLHEKLEGIKKQRQLVVEKGIEVVQHERMEKGDQKKVEEKKMKSEDLASATFVKELQFILHPAKVGPIRSSLLNIDGSPNLLQQQMRVDDLWGKLEQPTEGWQRDKFMIRAVRDYTANPSEDNTRALAMQLVSDWKALKSFPSILTDSLKDKDKFYDNFREHLKKLEKAGYAVPEDLKKEVNKHCAHQTSSAESPPLPLPPVMRTS